MQKQPEQSLQRCYDNLTASLQENINWLKSRDNVPNTVLKAATPCLNWHRNVLASLRTWAVDIGEDSRTLSKIEDESVSWHIRSNLIQLYDDLKDPEKICVVFESNTSKPLSHQDGQNKSKDSDSVILQAVADSIFTLQDTVESVRDLVAAHDSSGSYGPLKNAIDELTVQEEQKALYSTEEEDSIEQNFWFYDGQADDIDDPASIGLSQKDFQAAFKRSSYVADRSDTKTESEQSDSVSTAYKTGIFSDKTGGSSITSVSTKEINDDPLRLGAADVRAREYGLPGWTSWKRNSIGAFYRQLRDIKGTFVCTEWQQSGKCYNGDGKLLTRDVIQAVEQSLAETTRVNRATPSVTAIDSTKTSDIFPSITLTPASPSETKQSFIPDLDLVPGGSIEGESSYRSVSGFSRIETEPIHELLNDYIVRKAGFFRRGRVFRVLWIEPRGETSHNTSIIDAYSTLRPMVVVKQYGSHCMCAPIYSYGGQGVARPGLKRDEIEHHAIIHTSNTPPTILPGEEKWQFIMQAPFAVRAAEGETLRISSRIRFDMIFTIKYNVKVLSIGMIEGESEVNRLIACWDTASV